MPIMPIKQGNIRRSVAKKGKREMTKEEFKLWLKTFDTNGDGRISKQELRKAIRSVGGWFATCKSEHGVRSADANHDGYIDLETEIYNLLDFAKKHLGVKIVLN
ncbi:EF-hand domain [Macleaya cordata]|uniref:EF-hand domain n=1 Tax=Macleaya cordata TaxID=56857 RepID=A0A200QZC7_MACCD|nr:EF-hand domain [Macleaya cordata]